MRKAPQRSSYSQETPYLWEAVAGENLHRNLLSLACLAGHMQGILLSTETSSACMQCTVYGVYSMQWRSCLSTFGLCRCFVGTPQQMYDALIGKLSKLPPDVKVCPHVTQSRHAIHSLKLVVHACCMCDAVLLSGRPAVLQTKHLILKSRFTSAAPKAVDVAWMCRYGVGMSIQ